jgi:gp16 family phage-associated protein
MEVIMTPEAVKRKFNQQGKTFSSWARDNGYTPQEVSRVLNGFTKGTRGKSHEIAVKLGLKKEAA